MLNKIILIEVPTFGLAVYSKEGYEVSNKDNATYETLFHDNGGYCYFSLDEYKINSNELFNKNNDVNYLKNYTVVFVSKNDKEKYCIEGWYERAEIFKFRQSYFGVNFHIKAESCDVVWLPYDLESVYTDSIDRMRLANDSEIEKIKNLITKFDKEKRINIIFEDFLHKMPSIDNKEFNDKIIRIEELELDEHFKLLKKAKLLYESKKELQPLEVLLRIFGYLAQDSYLLKTAELLYKMKPDFETTKTFAFQLIFSDRIDEGIKLLNSLKNQFRYDDEIMYHLGIGYMLTGYPTDAYNNFDSIKSEAYKDQVEKFKQNIEYIYPNLNKQKTYKNHNNETIKLNPSIFSIGLEHNLDQKEQIINEKPYLIDLIRDKPILKTPEETVRQRMVFTLISKFGYPKNKILVEESISHINKKSQDRIDILVKSSNDSSNHYFLIVECKEPSRAIDGEAIEQILRYDSHLNAKFLLLTNGKDGVAFMKTTDGSLIPYNSIPKWHEIESSYESKFGVTWKRPDRTAIETDEIIDNQIFNGVIGEDSSRDVAIFASNLYYLLTDSNELIENEVAAQKCRLSQDYGVTKRTVGNPSGGFFEGEFRWFELKDQNGRISNMYVSVFGTGKFVNHPIYGNSKACTLILVAVDHNGNKTIPVLQIRLDKYAKFKGNKVEIYHDGRSSRQKSDYILQYINKEAPHLIVDNKVLLGELDCTYNLTFSQSKTVNFISNLLEYSLLRYQFKKINSKHVL